jgi:hypothetical protein
LLKKKAVPAASRVEEDDLAVLFGEEEVATPEPSKKVAGVSFVINSDEEDVLPERVVEEGEEGGEDDETPVMDAAEKKRAKREKKSLARTNQQLMIQSQLLGGNVDVPKKQPKKLDEFEFAQRLVGRLQHVVGRFVPDSQSAKTESVKEANRLYLTADVEASGSVARVPLEEDDEDELVVVAEEAQIKLEKPKPKISFRNDDIDSIFNANDEKVGALSFDSTRVWVSQLPTFCGVNLWDLSVKLVPRSGVVAKEESSSDDEYQDDELVDDIDFDEEDNGDVANDNGKLARMEEGGEEDEEEEEKVENPFDEDGDGDGDDDEPELMFSDEELDARNKHPGLSLGLEDSQEPVGNNSNNNISTSVTMGSLEMDQGIGFVLNQAIHSQQYSQFKSPGPKSSQKSVVDILLTPKKPFLSPLPVRAAVAVNLETQDKDEEEQEETHTRARNSVRRSLSLSMDMASPPSSPLKEAPILLSMDLESELPVIQEQQQQVVFESQPIAQTVVLESAPQSVVLSSVPAVSTSVAPLPSSLVVDPVERAKKKASTAGFLDRFVVRGDAAKKMAQVSLSKPVEPVLKQQNRKEDEVEEIEDDSENEKKRNLSDVFDDEGGKDLEEKSQTKKKSKVSFLEEQAVESDGEGGEQEKDEDEEGDEEDGEGEEVVEGEEHGGVDSEEGLFSSEGNEQEEQEEEEDDDQDNDVPALTAEQEQEKQDMEALNRLRMEKDLAELNRIKDLYVLGHWKTEKMMNRQQTLGMEDYVDDEFQPAWNSIYNRDQMRSRLQKKNAEEGGDDKNNTDNNNNNNKDEGGERDEKEVGSSDDEEEYERKREKLKQSIQLAKINSIFTGAPDMSRGESSLGGWDVCCVCVCVCDYFCFVWFICCFFFDVGFCTGLLLGGSNSVFLDAAPSSASVDLTGLGENSRLSRFIENRREASNAASGMFGALARDKTSDMDPTERLAMRRSNSKLLLNEGTLKRARSSSAAGVVNLTGRQFFEAGDSNAGNSSNSKKVPATPKKQTPQKKKTPQKTSLLARK